MPAAGSKSVSPGGWTDAEDAMLLRLVDVAGSNTWTTCARSLNKAFHNSNGNVRTGKQCRERWHNHLRPDIRTDPISKEEQMILIEAHKLHANKWTAIAGMLPHRTANQVKNYMNASLRMCQVVFQCTGIPAARKHIRKCLQHRCREMLEYVFNYLGSTQEVQENPNYMPLSTILQLLNDSLTEMQSDSDHLASLVSDRKPGDVRANSPKRRNSGTLASPSSKRSRDGGSARDSAAGMSAGAGGVGADFLNPAAALENSFNPAMAQFFAMQNLMYNPALFSQIAAMQASQMHAAGGGMSNQGGMPNTTESLANMLQGKGAPFGGAAGAGGGQSAPDMMELLRSFPGFGGPAAGAGFPQFPMLPMQMGQWNPDAMTALRAAMMPRMMGGMGQNMTPQAIAQLAGTNLMAGANAQMMEMLRAAGMQGGALGANVGANMDKSFSAWGADDAPAQASQLGAAGAADAGDDDEDEDDEDDDEDEDEADDDDAPHVKTPPEDDLLQQPKNSPHGDEPGTSALREAGLKGEFASDAGEDRGALGFGGAEDAMAGAMSSLHGLQVPGDHTFDASGAGLLDASAGLPMGVPHHMAAGAARDAAGLQGYHPPDSSLHLKAEGGTNSQ